ncbi:TetR-like C-terminal domain-containing protein [Nocardioides zeae]|uniref:TetR-like C-terminal domain-containing protein n=1 Tax=Nocardioides imazamoxiresistens TaxID=3231893 RepID=A0ABU3Q164_9ACTN|nr:TetR-like C-terminal domain-containing protein [Nocardioides zeae]MDT9595256.1 TetR-like C-terminal domain-containing protein [Nocardioides zeae]
MPRAGLSRAAVVAAALDLVDAEGLDALGPSPLAARLGVRPASLYSHVASAADLREGVCAAVLDELADRVADALAGRSGEAALRAFADAYRDYAHAHPGRYAASRLPVGPDSPAVPAGRRHAALAVAVLRGYAVPEAEQVHAVRLLGSLVHGYASLEQAGAFGHSEPGPEQSWPRVVAALDAALRTWST